MNATVCATVVSVHSHEKVWGARCTESRPFVQVKPRRQTQARLSVLIRRRAHNFRIARRTGVAHLGVIGKRKHRIQEPP